MEDKYSSARVPCKLCGRSFAPEVLAKHSNICKKTSVNASKRKVFDSSKQRVIEGELTLKQIKQAQKKDVKPPKSHWREKHADFINAVRSARGIQHAINSGGPLPPPPPPSINPDYIQCPYCSRRFAEKAAERHIDFCKDQQSRLPTNKQNSNAAAKQNARLSIEDLEFSETPEDEYQVPKPKLKTSPVVSTTAVTTTRGGGARPAATPPKGQVKPTPTTGRTPPSGVPSNTSTTSSSSRTGVASRGKAAPAPGRRN